MKVCPWQPWSTRVLQRKVLLQWRSTRCPGRSTHSHVTSQKGISDKWHISVLNKVIHEVRAKQNRAYNIIWDIDEPPHRTLYIYIYIWCSCLSTLMYTINWIDTIVTVNLRLYIYIYSLYTQKNIRLALAHLGLLGQQVQGHTGPSWSLFQEAKLDRSINEWVRV